MNGITALIAGRLGQDAAMYSTTEGAPMLCFSVRVIDEHARGGDPQWVRVAAFDALAEQFDGNLHRGDLVVCEGRLIVKTWDDQPSLELYCWSVERLAVGRATRSRARDAPASTTGAA